MHLVLGVDGGGTNTVAVIGDVTGKVLGLGVSGPSNYQNVGLPAAINSVKVAMEGATKTAGVGQRNITHGVFGVAGADFPEDFHLLSRGIREIFQGSSFSVLNDVWAGFRAGTSAKSGGVAALGTGANFGVLDLGGRHITGRGLGYEWGGLSGAEGLVRAALHFAFRSADKTGPETTLEGAVLQGFGCESFDELSLCMYKSPDLSGLVRKAASFVVPALFDHAQKGDAVCQDILTDAGSCAGSIMGSMLRSRGFENIPCDVIMVGGVFTGPTYPLLRTAFRLSCRKQVPWANFVICKVPPALGAFLLALDEVGIETGGEVRERAVATLGDV